MIGSFAEYLIRDRNIPASGVPNVWDLHSASVLQAAASRQFREPRPPILSVPPRFVRMEADMCEGSARFAPPLLRGHSRTLAHDGVLALLSKIVRTGHLLRA